MELRTMAYVEAVARLGTFTAAAQELHVAQPAVSAQIAAAERELGVALFVRGPRGARPTEAGRLTIERAGRLRAELTGLHTDLADLAGLQRGTLRVGATPLLGPIDLPAAAARLRSAHPGLRLQLRTALIAPLLSQLEGGDLDLVVGPLDGVEGRGLRSIVLSRDSLVLAAPSTSPRPRSLGEVRSRPFICLPQGSGLRSLVDQACAGYGFAPRVDIEVSDPRAMLDYVAAGLGVAVLAASLVAHGPTGVAVVRIPRAPAHPPLGVVMTGTGSAAARALTAVLTAAAQG